MKNYKVGIIGTENSHANAFCKAFNVVKEDGTTAYPDFHVNLVYGDYPEASQKTVDKFKADAIANNVEQMVEECDCAMITCRDGKFHAKYAKPFIEAGKPLFIDKPFTCDVNEAVELVRLAKEKGVTLCGGSSMKYNPCVLGLKKIKEDMGEKISRWLRFRTIKLCKRLRQFLVLCRSSIRNLLRNFRVETACSYRR